MARNVRSGERTHACCDLNIFFIGVTGIDKIALKIRFIEIQNTFNMRLIMPDVTDAASQLKVLTRLDPTVSTVLTVSSLGSFVRMSLWHIVNNTLDNNAVTPLPPTLRSTFLSLTVTFM